MKCPECNGTGKKTVETMIDGRHPLVDCRNCLGTGKLNKFQAKQLKQAAFDAKEEKKKLKQSVEDLNAALKMEREQNQEWKEEAKVAREQRDFYQKQAKDNQALADLVTLSIGCFVMHGINLDNAGEMNIALNVLLKDAKEHHPEIIKWLYSQGVACEAFKGIPPVPEDVEQFNSIVNSDGFFCPECADAAGITRAKVMTGFFKCRVCGKEFKDGQVVEKKIEVIDKAEVKAVSVHEDGISVMGNIVESHKEPDEEEKEGEKNVTDSEDSSSI